MSIKPPKHIAIDHDDYHAEFVGKTADGKQFFLTTPFIPASPTNPGNEFVALYLFDKRGNLIEALIDEFGRRNNMNTDARDALCQKRLDDLGVIEFGRIEIAPFRFAISGQSGVRVSGRNNSPNFHRGFISQDESKQMGLGQRE
jgi:hypothetical protein